jgi:hypothetical protein
VVTVVGGAMILGMIDPSTRQSFGRLCVAFCGIDVDTEDGERQAGMAIESRPVSEVVG